MPLIGLIIFLMTLPKEFTQNTIGTINAHLWQNLLEALEKEPTTSIRINPFKPTIGKFNSSIFDAKVPWSNEGYYLKIRINFTFDPLLHAGVYYIQDASSMFLSYVLKQYLKDEPTLMLDLSASPGGKSIVARGALPKNSLLISNEPIELRARVLEENMLKFGHPDVIVTNNYPKDFLKSGLMFDVILTDVPCSGEGMFRKDPIAIKQWSPQNVEKSSRLQKEIVSSAWQVLKPNGILIYSTCTFNTKENEENILWFKENLGAEILPINTEKGWNISSSLLKGFNFPVYRFLPGLTKGEGLFMAVLRKKEDASFIKGNTLKKKNLKASKEKISPIIKEWILSNEDYDIIKKGDDLVAIPKRWKAIYNIVEEKLKPLSLGILLGKIKGKEIQPSHSLAMSSELNLSAFEKVEIDFSQAITYLRRETLNLKKELPKGYILLTYHNHPLGFGKNIGNRINNLYPSSWKIRSTHLPKGIKEILEF